MEAAPNDSITPEQSSEEPALSIWQRLSRWLFFWRYGQDPIAVTLLAPASVLPGESSALQVVVHHAGRSAQAQALPEWRGSENIEPLVHRGSSVNLHIALQQITMTTPLQHLKWSGFSAALLFNLRVPDDWPAGKPVQGSLSVSVDQVRVAQMDFSLPVGAPNSALQL